MHTDDGKKFDPKKGYEDGSRKVWNKGLTKETSEKVKQYSATMKSKFERGEIELTGCVSKEYLGSEQHRKSSSKGGGYREKAGRSKKFRVVDSFGNEVVLQSTFELKCSEILNGLNVKWIRPRHLKYEGKKYFADFYLTDHNLYLDPKNDYKAKMDEEKIRKVREQNNVDVFILREQQLTEEYIGSLI